LDEVDSGRSNGRELSTEGTEGHGKRGRMMSIGHVNPELATRLPLQRIAEICERYGVSEHSVYGPILERDVQEDVEILFLA
jgi:hypothetical protein